MSVVDLRYVACCLRLAIFVTVDSILVVGFLRTLLYVVSSSSRLFDFSSYFDLSTITIALPLSAGGMTMLQSPFSG